MGMTKEEFTRMTMSLMAKRRREKTHKAKRPGYEADQVTYASTERIRRKKAQMNGR